MYAKGEKMSKENTIQLSKNECILLKKKDCLDYVIVGLGWTPKPHGRSGADVDLDASIILLNKEGLMSSNRDLIFYNNKKSKCKSIIHLGDDRTGNNKQTKQDNEQIQVKLSQLPPDIVSVQIIISIYDAENNKQNFGQINKAYCRILSEDKEIMNYNLTEDHSVSTSVKIGEFEKQEDDSWIFTAKGVGYKGGLAEILEEVYFGGVEKE